MGFQASPNSDASCIFLNHLSMERFHIHKLREIYGIIEDVIMALFSLTTGFTLSIIACRDSHVKEAITLMAIESLQTFSNGKLA